MTACACCWQEHLPSNSREINSHKVHDILSENFHTSKLLITHLVHQPPGFLTPFHYLELPPSSPGPPTCRLMRSGSMSLSRPECTITFGTQLPPKVRPYHFTSPSLALAKFTLSGGRNPCRQHQRLSRGSWQQGLVQVDQRLLSYSALAGKVRPRGLASVPLPTLEARRA